MKRIALINDLSGFGKCSLTAAIPVISVMGIQACPLPTAILSAQTGFSSYFFDDYTDKMNGITDEWEKMKVAFDGISSGYLAGKEQIENVLYFIEKFKTKENLYLLDPIMGDNGRTIKNFNEELLYGMRILAQKADVITPNLTELCLLANADYEKLVSYKKEEDYLKRIQEVAWQVLKKMKNNQRIIVTGIIREKDRKELMGNLAVFDGGTYHVEASYTGRSFSGTGDLFSSVICGSLVNELSLEEAMNKAVDFLQIAIEEASAEDSFSAHGVNFEKYLYRLV